MSHAEVRLSEGQYRDLCEACDELLAEDASDERVAISWLHVIREHPVFVRQYAHLFDAGKGPLRRLAKLSRYGAQAGWRLLQAAWRRSATPWTASGELPCDIDVLFVTHLVNASHAGQANDFYFGELPNILADSGQSVVIALINHAAAPEAIVSRWEGAAVPRVVLSRVLRVADEARNAARMVTAASRVARSRPSRRAKLSRLAAQWASVEALGGATAFTLRVENQVRALVSALRPACIVLTHEGHAYERIAFAAARAVNPRIRCVGYQHAALFRLQHAIRRPLSPAFNPDAILTAGEVALRQLDRVVALETSVKAVLGSNRALDERKFAARRFAVAAPQGEVDACLVVPEGFESECAHLFGFALECARLAKDTRFILRTHPLISPRSLEKRIPALRHPPPNVEISTRSLEADLAQSRWVLYRGTTVVIQAILADLRPVYLRLAGELTIDPLYELQQGRDIVTRPCDLVQLMTTAIASPQRGTIEPVKAYCRDFFLPLKPTVLLEQFAQGPANPQG